MGREVEPADGWDLERRAAQRDRMRAMRDAAGVPGDVPFDDSWEGLRLVDELNEWAQSGAPVPLPNSCAFCGESVDRDEGGAMFISFDGPARQFLFGTHLKCIRDRVDASSKRSFETGVELVEDDE